MSNKGSVTPGLAVAAATAVGVLRGLPGPSARTAHPLWSEHAPVSDRDCAAMSFAQKVTSLGFRRCTASRFLNLHFMEGALREALSSSQPLEASLVAFIPKAVATGFGKNTPESLARSLIFAPHFAKLR